MLGRYSMDPPELYLLSLLPSAYLARLTASLLEASSCIILEFFGMKFTMTLSCYVTFFFSSTVFFYFLNFSIR